MAVPLEREFKLRIPDEDAFAALLARLSAGAPARAVHQESHFFDTPGRDLGTARIALRLRAEGGAWALALKGPELGGTGALAVRAEEERGVAEEHARAILAGALCPLRELAALVGGASPLVADARKRAGDARLVRLGGFENERTRVGPVALPGDPGGTPLVMELDRTRFPDGRIEREFELELGPDADARAVHAALAALFSSVGIPLESVPSKAARLFRILDRRG